MSPEQLTICIVLIISAALSRLYSLFLERIHDIYTPDYIWLTVVCGNGMVLGTLAALEYALGIALTTMLVLYVNIAWGTPIVYWQLWQQWQREKQEHQLEGK